MNRLRLELAVLSIVIMVVFLPTLGFSLTCNQTSLLPLAPCLPYVEAGNTTNPGSDCCTPLGSLLSSNPTCFCDLAPLAHQYNLAVNTSRALEVAVLCKLTIPATVSSCLANIAPVGSPSGSIINSPLSTPSGSSTPGTTTPQSGAPGNALSRSSFVVAVVMVCALVPL